MLNLSENEITIDELEKDGIKSHQSVFQLLAIRKVANVVYILLAFAMLILFLPWTQNVYMEGYLTTLEPETRPQEIQTIIDGRIDAWYVKEGGFVKQGDTIARIGEIKDIYWDPLIIDRTKEQILAKKMAIDAYSQKIVAQEKQEQQLRLNLNLKLKQTKNKLIQTKLKLSADSANIIAAQTDYANFKAQYERGKELFARDLISRNELESRQNRIQSAMAKLNKAENDFAINNNEFLNIEIELNNLEAEYLEKIFKIQSEIQSVISDYSKANEELAKLNNLLASYIIRSGNYYITAPQNGQIINIFKAGLGENVKAGEALASITPDRQHLAVAFYVPAIDVPLFEKGRHIRILFDGWPAIVFSGWPGASFGTFGGNVKVIDNNISDNGMFRLLIAPDTTTRDRWPTQLVMGSGAKGYALLKDVPVWYELWRRLNGFPPEFYQSNSTSDQTGKSARASSSDKGGKQK